MRKDFEPCLKSIFSEEGVYSNDKDDSGGETYYGIARNMNPKWAGWSIIDAYKKEKNFPKCLETHEELQRLKVEFYLKNYWIPIGGDVLTNFNVIKELFDGGVNMGVKTTIKQSQEALGLKITGVMDAKTIEKLNRVIG